MKCPRHCFKHFVDNLHHKSRAGLHSLVTRDPTADMQKMTLVMNNLMIKGPKEYFI